MLVRYTFAFLFLGILSSHVAGQDQSPPGFGEIVRPFLAKHCLSCHGDKKPKGELRLDTLAVDFNDKKSAEVWANVYARLRDGEMPPRKQPQPKAEETKTVLKWLAEQTGKVSARALLNRRLNRYEFEYSLRDLFDLPGLEVKELLPRDGESEGFDNVGAGLDISYVQMARFLEGVETMLDQAAATGLLPLKPEAQKLKFWPQDSYDWSHRMKYGFTIPLGDNGPHPLLDREKGIVDVSVHDLRKLPRFKALANFFHSDSSAQHRFQTGVRIPAAGLYKLTISAYTFDWNKGQIEPAKFARPYSISTDTRVLGYFDAPPNEAGLSTVTTWLEPSDNIHFNAVSLHHGHGLNKGAMSYKGPAVAIEWVEAEGPLVKIWPPVARTRLYGDLPLAEWQPKSKFPKPSRPKGISHFYSPTSQDPLADAEKLLKEFCYRSCRRPLTKEQLQPFLKLVRAKLDDQSTFEEAMRTAYKGVLCSPHFLFLRSEPGKIDPYAVGSRLSYFLWSSLPDEDLLHRTNTKAILQPAVLQAQTERMLNDPKFERFLESFLGQWLKLREIKNNQPDRQLYPEAELESDISHYLFDSMASETRQFFANMIKKDLSITHLIDSDFAIINEPLAKLYGIKDVKGVALREVPLPNDSHRGGILTQASILKVSANGTTTSPVVRGVFVTSRLLGRPVPPPPPNITGIDPDVRGSTTIREQLIKHRDNPSCYACHAKMDPPGFALESFDVIGQWRDRYRFLNDNRMNPKGPLVDASGETEDGQKYQNIDEFKKIVLANPVPLARNLVAKLMVYATGAALTPADRLEVDEIVKRLGAKNYGLRSMIHEIVQSKAFRQE